jgi:glycine/D-amino acid oxidase-like deaminating enzyme
MIKTIVIGAGVMGASVAYRLAQAGAAVTVLEATRIGGGTSGISFAWTNAHKKPPKPYHELNVAGMKAHAALADEFGATPWWHGGGSLRCAARSGSASHSTKNGLSRSEQRTVRKTQKQSLDRKSPIQVCEPSVPESPRLRSPAVGSNRDPPRFQSICLNRRLESSLGGVPIGADRDPAMRADKQAE